MALSQKELSGAEQRLAFLQQIGPAISGSVRRAFSDDSLDLETNCPSRDGKLLRLLNQTRPDVRLLVGNWNLYKKMVSSFKSQSPRLTVLPCIGVNCGFLEILGLVVLTQVLNFPLAADVVRTERCIYPIPPAVVFAFHICHIFVFGYRLRAISSLRFRLFMKFTGFGNENEWILPGLGLFLRYLLG